MAKLIQKGDAIRLIEPMEVIEKTDAMRRKYFTVQLHWDAKNIKAPYTLLDSFVGLYLGTVYIPIQSKKTDSGMINTMQHMFFFNSTKIFIDPKYVEVVASYDSAVG